MLDPRDANLIHKRYSKVFIAGYKRERSTVQVRYNAHGVGLRAFRILEDRINTLWSRESAGIGEDSGRPRQRVAEYYVRHRNQKRNVPTQ